MLAWNVVKISCRKGAHLVLDLVEKGLVTDQMVLDIGYDIENMQKDYWGSVHVDHYGRTVPKPAHGSVNLGKYTSSSKLILDAMVDLYERITRPDLLVRWVTVTANHVISEKRAAQFSPFAAMVGHDAAIRETARLTEEQLELSEDEKAVIDGKLQMIQAHTKEQPAGAKQSHHAPAPTLAHPCALEVTVTYFQPDEKKSGGALERHRRFTAVNDAHAKTPQEASPRGAVRLAGVDGYVTDTGPVKKIDEQGHLLILQNETSIHISDIIDIQDINNI